MSKITDISGNSIVSKVPTIKGVRPVGTQIIVELLTPNEIMGTNLELSGTTGSVVNGAPQGYIVAIGPMVDAKWGLEVGQRVVLSGNFTPLPEQASKNGRALGTVEPHIIKSILLEK